MIETIRNPRTRRASWLAVFTLVASSIASAAWQGTELNDGDHRKLGRILNKYFGEKTAEKDREKAKSELIGELEKIGKKRGVKESGESVRAALALTADLGKAIAYSTEYKNLRGGKTITEKIEVGDETFEYALLLPSSYKSTGAALPLVLCVPELKDGKPMSPTTFLQEQLLDPALRDGAILAAVEMPSDPATWSVIRTEGGRMGGLYAIMKTLAEVRQSVAVDPDRVFVVGRQQGAAAAMTIVGKFPHLFAGAAALAGDIGDISSTNFCNVPTFLQGGAQSTTFEEQNKQAGYNNCTIKSDATPADFWSWAQQTVRVSNPAKIALEPEPLGAFKAYWIEFEPTEGLKGVINATADKSSNTIKIDASGIRTITVYFNDAIVDLSKPVKIVLNGQEQEVEIARSVDDFLLLIGRGTSDAGKLYVATRPFDLSAR